MTDTQQDDWHFVEHDEHPGFRSNTEDGEFYCLRCHMHLPENLIAFISVRAAEADRLRALLTEAVNISVCEFAIPCARLISEFGMPDHKLCPRCDWLNRVEKEQQ